MLCMFRRRNEERLDFGDVWGSVAGDCLLFQATILR